jgi:hypothetical protein
VSRAERSLRAALAATSAFAVGYLLPGPLQLPVLLYDPLNARLWFGVHPGGMVMRYLGDLLVGCSAALLAALLGWRTASTRTPLAVPSGIAMSLIALDVAYYLSRLWTAV